MSVHVEAPSKPAVLPTTLKQALDEARAAAQDLHGALSDAVAKRGGAIKADLEAIPLQATAIAEQLQHALGAPGKVDNAAFDRAVVNLEATSAHVAKALKRSGKVAETAARHALADARASVQSLSEAVAVHRSATSQSSPKI